MKDEIDETGSGYSILWKGKTTLEPQIYCVGFALKTSHVHEVNLQPKAINKRMMYLRIPFPSDNFMTVISVYASARENAEASNDEFVTPSPRCRQGASCLSLVTLTHCFINKFSQQ